MPRSRTVSEAAQVVPSDNEVKDSEDIIINEADNASEEEIAVVEIVVAIATADAVAHPR